MPQGDLESAVLSLARESVPLLLDSVSEVLDSLEENVGEANEPTKASVTPAIYCMGGRSPFDAGVCAIMSPCLKNEGMAASTLDGAVNQPDMS